MSVESNSKPLEFTERDPLLPLNESTDKIGPLKIIFFFIACGVSVVALACYGLVSSLPENTVLGQSASSFNTGTGSNNDPIVRTNAGRVRGIKLQSRKGRDFYAFYAVPYAQPPTGDLRFMAPQPIQRWNGTKNATTKGSICVQLKMSWSDVPELKNNTSEDCLYVNVFTPKLPERRGRQEQGTSHFPVMAYLHGGAFTRGSANEYGPEYIMDEDTVLVMIESRVGALGYLNTGDGVIPGNMGLKDQVLALKWIQDNIHTFNGDKSNVALMGYSAGGMQTHAHLLSPMSKGLFAKAIIAGGVSITPGGMMFDFNPKRSAEKLADKLNCSYQGLLDCLRNKMAKDIVLAQPQSGPSLDQDSGEAFFPATPINMLMAQEFNGSKVPTMFGIVKDETQSQAANLILDENFTTQVNQDFISVMAYLLNWELFGNPDEVMGDLRKINDFYFGNEIIRNETRWNLTDLLSDRFYFHPTKLAALKHAENGNNVYIYYFTRQGNYSMADDLKTIFPPPYGVGHADEIQYLFHWDKFPYIHEDSQDFEFSEMFVKMHVGFLKTGSPEVPTEWTKLDPVDKGRIWYDVNNEPKMAAPFSQRMELWDSFNFQLLYNTTSDHLSTPFLGWGTTIDKILEKW